MGRAYRDEWNFSGTATGWVPAKFALLVQNLPTRTRLQNKPEIPNPSQLKIGRPAEYPPITRPRVLVSPRPLFTHPHDSSGIMRLPSQKPMELNSHATNLTKSHMIKKKPQLEPAKPLRSPSPQLSENENEMKRKGSKEGVGGDQEKVLPFNFSHLCFVFLDFSYVFPRFPLFFFWSSGVLIGREAWSGGKLVRARVSVLPWSLNQVGGPERRRTGKLKQWVGFCVSILLRGFGGRVHEESSLKPFKSRPMCEITNLEYNSGLVNKLVSHI